jgi:hypothetical protein
MREGKKKTSEKKKSVEKKPPSSAEPMSVVPGLFVAAIARIRLVSHLVTTRLGGVGARAEQSRAGWKKKIKETHEIPQSSTRWMPRQMTSQRR